MSQNDDSSAGCKRKLHFHGNNALCCVPQCTNRWDIIFMYYQIEGYGICQCIVKVEIHKGEPKMYLFISKYTQMENVNTYTLKKTGIQPQTAHFGAI